MKMGILNTWTNIVMLQIINYQNKQIIFFITTNKKVQTYNTSPYQKVYKKTFFKT